MHWRDDIHQRFSTFLVVRTTNYVKKTLRPTYNMYTGIKYKHSQNIRR